MSLTTLSILLLCIQPFVIYKAMFSEKEVENKEDLEFSLSLVVIAPGFIFFYLDNFWYALLLLGSVSLLGGLLVKLCSKKAKRSLTLKELYYFMIVWLGVFAMGYGLVSLYQFIANWFTAPADVYTTEAINIAAVTQVELPSKPLLPNILPSLYFLAAVIATFLIRVIEVHKFLKEELTGFLLLVLGIAATIAPFFSDYHLLSLAFNSIVFMAGTGAVLSYKQDDPSAAGVMFVYSNVLIMAAVGSLMIKGVMWLLS